MSLLIENPETGEESILQQGTDGRYPNIRLPWRVRGAVISTAQAQEIVKREQTHRMVTINVDDKLNKIAAMLFIPAADVLKVVGAALGINCAYCQLRFMIWKKAREIGWWKVIYLTAKSIKAQIAQDEEKLREMAKELET